MITFIRCSDAETDVSRRSVKVTSSGKEVRRGSMIERAGIAFVYMLGLVMVLLQLRSIL
ncbi:MAG: hypothetical protein HDS23_03895 [Bacteroides sp.]|nr:hypothetical protein [Bacteroides sp.]MBD5337849.1 hypothetical protein [Bacteroides sp.]